jgi:DNA polymerase-3 subunit epsilon
VTTFAAIDFETATRSRSSACALGVVLSDGRNVLDEASWLIRPPSNHYEWRNIQIHGIEPAHTADSPGMEEVWAEASELIGDAILVAHNAPFDMGVLQRSLESSGEIVEADYACTVSLARKLLPGLRHYKLPDVSFELGIDLDNHHDALADARACCEIAITLLERAGERSLRALAEVAGVKIRRIEPAIA